jgi:hypothetical protein
MVGTVVGQSDDGEFPIRVDLERHGKLDFREDELEAYNPPITIEGVVSCRIDYAFIGDTSALAFLHPHLGKRVKLTLEVMSPSVPSPRSDEPHEVID